MPDSAVTCFLEAHLAKRAVRLERTAPSVEGYPVREEYVTDDTGLIAVTIDMSQDPYGGFRLERKVCRGAAATGTGYLAFAGCKLVEVPSKSMRSGGDQFGPHSPRPSRRPGGL
jgi:hypothetical protein